MTMPSPTVSLPPGVGVPVSYDYLIILDLEANGDDIGDVQRQEITEWPWVVYDLHSHAVVDAKLVYIAPQWGANPNPSPDQVFGLGIDVAFSPSLKDAVAKFDAYIYHSFVPHMKRFCLMTDGPWDLRGILQLEATRKAVQLAPHFRTYFNLRTEFSRCYPSAPPPNDRQAMVNYLSIPRSARAAGLDNCRTMAEVVARLQRDHHSFTDPEVIPEYSWATMTSRIPAVAVPVAAAVPVGGIVRLRGLPWSCGEQDVLDFFEGIPVVPNGVHFVRNAHGKATGEAFVQLHAQESVHLALQQHKKMMGRRYIEVFKSSPVDMSNHLGRADARRQLHQQQMLHAQAHKAAAAAAANAAAAVAASGNSSSARVPMPVGSPPTASGSRIAQQGHHSPGPGVRHNSAPSDNSHQQHSNRQHHPVLSAHHPPSRNSGTTKSYVIRVRNLPQNATPDDIVRLCDGLEMVGDGIHMLPRTNGAGCNGEALVEFTSETWAKKALGRSPMTLANHEVVFCRSSRAELAAALEELSRRKGGRHRSGSRLDTSGTSSRPATFHNTSTDRSTNARGAIVSP